MPVAGSDTAFERALKAAAGLPGVEKIVVLGDGDLCRDKECELVTRPAWTGRNLLEAMDTCSEGFDDIFFFHADYPLLDVDLTSRMYEDHREYFAEYTFADGYPVGLTPEILKKKIMKPLLHLADTGQEPVARDSIFRVIQRDINSFDIETKISPVDLRLLRASLTCDTKRNHLLVERVVEAGGRDEGTILTILQERADLLRTLPAYVAVQATDRYPQPVAYLPKNYYPVIGVESGKELDEEKIIPILEHIADFAGDIVIGLSYRGDPSMHSGIRSLVRGALDIPETRILLETSGIGWPVGSIEDILSMAEGRIAWIVELDARDRELYYRLRGEGYEEAYRTAEFLASAAPESTYLQAVRMKENEEDLEQFYRFWKEKSEHVIIQKYDFFCGLLPQKKVTDLSPLKRFPCWHIKRDLYILLDGTVPMCGEDLGPALVLGNVFRDPLEKIWKGGDKIYASHVSGEYPSICAECDEYYTFNF